MTSAAIALRSGAGERDVAEQRMAPQRVDHRRDAVVAADPQVVALRDVVGEHDAAALAEARQRGEQHRPLEVLRLVDDHEGVGEAAAADVGERQHLEQALVEHGVDDLGPTMASSASVTAAAHGDIFSASVPGRKPRSWPPTA